MKKKTKKPNIQLFSKSKILRSRKLIPIGIFALAIGIQQFVACLNQPGVSSTRARTLFDHSGLKVCINCHLSERPSGAIRGFNHSPGATGDCAPCHNAPGRTWTGGLFNHTPVPSTCLECHSHQRPVGRAGSPPYDHAIGGTGDCVLCHVQTAGTSWAGGKLFTHSPVPSTCVQCHESNRPTVANYPDGGGTASGHYAPKDCYNCHLPKSASTTAFRFNHLNAGFQRVNTCLPCHQSLGDSKHGPGFGDCVNCHNNFSEW